MTDLNLYIELKKAVGELLKYPVEWEKFHDALAKLKEVYEQMED